MLCQLDLFYKHRDDKHSLSDGLLEKQQPPSI